MSVKKDGGVPGPSLRQLKDYVDQNGEDLLKDIPGLLQLRIAEDAQGPFIWLILKAPEKGKHRQWAWPLLKKGKQLRFKMKWVRRKRRKPATKDPC